MGFFIIWAVYSVFHKVAYVTEYASLISLVTLIHSRRSNKYQLATHFRSAKDLLRRRFIIPVLPCSLPHFQTMLYHDRREKSDKFTARTVLSKNLITNRLLDDRSWLHHICQPTRYTPYTRWDTARYNCALKLEANSTSLTDATRAAHIRDVLTKIWRADDKNRAYKTHIHFRSLYDTVIRSKIGRLLLLAQECVTSMHNEAKHGLQNCVAYGKGIERSNPGRVTGHNHERLQYAR